LDGLSIRTDPDASGQREEPPMDTQMHTNEEPSTWETPEFVEIRMDAEVGSYQDDFDGQDWH